MPIFITDKQLDYDIFIIYCCYNSIKMYCQMLLLFYVTILMRGGVLFLYEKYFKNFFTNGYQKKEFI